MGAHEKTIAVPEEAPPVLQSLGQDEIVVEMLSLNQCLQAGPLKPILRDKHLTLKSFLGHLGFESLKQRPSPTWLEVSLKVMEAVGMCLSHLPFEVGPLPRRSSQRVVTGGFCFSPISREVLLISSGSCCDPACPGDFHHGGHLHHLEAKKVKR